MPFLRVREIAEAQGLNMSKLSQRSELAYNTVRGLWHDSSDQLNRRTLIRVARVLGVTVGELFAPDAHKEEEPKKGLDSGAAS